MNFLEYLRIKNSNKNIVLSSSENDEIFERINHQTNLNKLINVNTKYFSELFHELKNNPNCSYVTSINDFEKNDIIDKISFVPVYEKEYYYKLMACAKIETFASRLANFFGVPTVYNIISYNKDRTYKLLSANFLKNGENFIKISELTNNYLSNLDFITWEKVFEEIMSNQNEENVNNFMSDFTKQYLFRKYVLRDSDYSFNNCGIIVDQDDQFRLSPCFDMEFSFELNFDEENYGDLKYIAQKYPKEYHYVKDKFNELFSNQNLHSILKKSPLSFFEKKQLKSQLIKSKEIFEFNKIMEIEK